MLSQVNCSLEMLLRQHEIAEGKQCASKRTMPDHLRYRITELFSLGKQRLAELDRSIMTSSHPIMPPQTEDRLYLLLGVTNLRAQAASAFKRSVGIVGRISLDRDEAESQRQMNLQFRGKMLRRFRQQMQQLQRFLKLYCGFEVS